MVNLYASYNGNDKMVLTINPSKIDGSESAVSWTDPQLLLISLSCGLCIEIFQFSKGVRSAASSFQAIDADALANRLIKNSANSVVHQLVQILRTRVQRFLPKA